MDLHLKDATILVTGSSAGIGQATAIAYGAEGARVAVTYHKDRQGAEETKQKILDSGGKLSSRIMIWLIQTRSVRVLSKSRMNGAR